MLQELYIRLELVLRISNRNRGHRRKLQRHDSIFRAALVQGIEGDHIDISIPRLRNRGDLKILGRRSDMVNTSLRMLELRTLLGHFVDPMYRSLQINHLFQSEELNLMHRPLKRTRRGASSSTPNQRQNNYTESKDLLSLPNDILEEILGFLEVKQLVQFSAVAKQFRYCFKYGKRLDFDLSFQRTLIDMDQYEPIVRQIIDQHDRPKIQSLKLCFFPTNDVDNQALVADWIIKAAEKQVEELELDFNRSLDPFRVTCDLLFQIRTLEVLRLVNVDLGSPINDVQITGLHFLKVCSMKNLNINVVILDALLNNCTELEIVEIIDCCTPNRFKFSPGNLNKFVKFRLANCISLKEITIEAPSLTTLHYSGQLIEMNFEHCYNVVEFLLDLKSTRWTIVYINQFLMDKLMAKFWGIKVLTTTSILVEIMCMKFASEGMMDTFHSFPMVKEINLTMERSRRCNLFAMTYFFRKFPRCKRLFIDVRGWFQEIQHTSLANGGGWKLALRQLQLQLRRLPSARTILSDPALARSNPYLEQLKLTGFRFNTNEMELLCYFLISGHNFKTVTIFLASPCHWKSAAPDEAVFNYQLRSLITSPNLWIKIYPHKYGKDLYPPKHPKNWRKG
ncbi:FBD-associated F-box protein At1g61320 [Linum grandiflorum]